MRGKKLYLVLSFLGILTLVCGFIGANKPPVTIDNISVETGLFNTKIVLESTSQLAVLNSQYLEGTAPKLIVELDRVNAQETSSLRFDEASVVKNMSMEAGENNSCRLMFDLKEKVPYRIYSAQKGTVIEFNTFQNGQKDYLLDPELQQKLESNLTSNVFLKGVRVSSDDNHVDVIAELTEETLSHVFVLKDPLRLVVDLHNTLYSSKATNLSIKRLGVEKVRTAQFQHGDPYTITRMVFDLSEPQLYSISTDRDSLKVSFFKKVEMAFTEPSKETPKPPEIKDQPPAEIKTEPEKARVDPEEMTLSETVEFPEAKRPEENQDPDTQTTQFMPRTLEQKDMKYKGETLSLKFADADLQAVVFYLAEFAGLNVTFDPGVTGIVSVNLIDVPWDQALDLLLKQNKMGKIIEGNVLRIAPIGVLTREQEDLRRLEESKELSGPLVTRSYTLSYSRAGDVQALLQSKISNRGEIIVDNRTNTLIISDVEDRMGLIETLIETFDTPTPQVSIEARIVEATSNFVRNLGVQWGFRAIQDPFYGNQGTLKFPNRSLIDGAMIPQGIVTKGIGGPLGGYGINLPAPAFSTAVGLSFANVLDTFRLDMALTALETSGSGKIISAPKVTTQNNQEAEIIQGRQIPV
ncbi:MAG: AMIN domain-containing protein, partial [Candidatus Aminicenantes bacterium]|nr:AMIN domain-containing protein [Candidatus Aminicenantes bacterium]